MKNDCYIIIVSFHSFCRLSQYEYIVMLFIDNDNYLRKLIIIQIH